MRALVTGANRGIGQEVVRQLVAGGHDVVLTARDPAAAAVARAVGASFLALDVTDPVAVATAAQRLGPVDALVCHAGVSMSGFDARVARETLAVNYHGAVRVADAFVGAMPDGARIVFVSSGMGELAGLGAARRWFEGDVSRGEIDAAVERFVADVAAGDHAARGWPTWAYRVSKAALNAATRAFARDWPALHVNAVCPGWVATDMGGRSAPRSVAVGAAGVVWAATAAQGSGGFYRDGSPIPW